MQRLEIAFLLFPNLTQLDLTGPVQVLSRLDNAAIRLVAASLDPVMTDAGFSINPTATYADCPAPHVICVPGGAGADDAMLDEALLAWLRGAASTAQWVTSVCTGSLVLGAAGLLRGKRATSHWLSRELLAGFGAIPVAERVVLDGKLVTGGGVTAGIDFALGLTALLRGEDYAKAVQLALEYDPQPPFRAGSPEGAGEAITARVRAQAGSRQEARRAKVAEAVARLAERGD